MKASSLWVLGVGGPGISKARSVAKEVISVCSCWIVMNSCVWAELLPSTAAVRLCFLRVSPCRSHRGGSAFKTPLQKSSPNIPGRFECGFWQPGAFMKYTQGHTQTQEPHHSQHTSNRRADWQLRLEEPDSFLSSACEASGVRLVFGTRLIYFCLLDFVCVNLRQKWE